MGPSSGRFLGPLYLLSSLWNRLRTFILPLSTLQSPSTLSDHRVKTPAPCFTLSFPNDPALSRADSDSAPSASAPIRLTDRQAQLTISPTARSNIRRRQVASGFPHFGLKCPPVNRRPGHVARSRLCCNRNALRKCNGKFDFRSFTTLCASDKKC